MTVPTDLSKTASAALMKREKAYTVVKGWEEMKITFLFLPELAFATERVFS